MRTEKKHDSGPRPLGRLIDRWRLLVNLQYSYYALPLPTPSVTPDTWVIVHSYGNCICNARHIVAGDEGRGTELEKFLETVRTVLLEASAHSASTASPAMCNGCSELDGNLSCFPFGDTRRAAVLERMVEARES